MIGESTRNTQLDSSLRRKRQLPVPQGAPPATKQQNQVLNPNQYKKVHSNG